MEKQCTKCKVLLQLECFSKDKHKASGYRSACKKCSSLEFQNFRNSDAYQARLEKVKTGRKTKKNIDPVSVWVHDVFHNAKYRSKKNGIEFSITKKWVALSVVKFCPLLQIELNYGASKSSDSSASIDRVDSSKGYTPENCKIISFKANRIKNNATLQDIQMLAKNLGAYESGR